MEHVYPRGILHSTEEKTITSLAFPESNSLSMNEGNLLYTFRLRHFNKLPLSAISPQEHSFSFGFTLFNQRRDSASSRGYTQRSIVIVTDLYFVQFYYQLVEILASQCLHCFYPNRGVDEENSKSVEQVLEEFYRQLLSWSIPLPGSSVDQLSVFDYLIQIDLLKDMLDNLNLSQRQKRIEFIRKRGFVAKPSEPNVFEKQPTIEGEASVVESQERD